MNLKTLQRKLFKPIVPVIPIHGIINYKMVQKVHESLSRVDTITARALAVSINSRGGAPVQSELIVHKLRSFAKQHHLPLYTFAEDVAASGGYMILCAGDKVYADRSSIVGSIGVVSSRFDLQRIAEKFGIQRRRVDTTEKSVRQFIDPFIAPNEATKEEMAELSKFIHQEFIQHVENYRGQKLKVAKADRKARLYEADVFDGEEAVALGLVDEVGTTMGVLGQEFPNCRIQLVQEEGLMQNLAKMF